MLEDGHESLEDEESLEEPDIPENHKLLQTMKNRAWTAQSSSIINQLTADLQKSERSIIRYMRGIAMKCFTGQRYTLTELAHYIERLSGSGAIKCVALTFQQVYDETQHNLRVEFAGGAGLEGQTAKTFVVESAWTMLLHCIGGVGFNEAEALAAKSWLRIQGTWSPTFLSADSATGQATASVLAKAPMLPPSLTKLFRFSTRLGESDEAAANAKAERLFQTYLRSEGFVFEHVHWACSAHKAHAMAEKTFDMADAALAGVCATLLAVQKAQPLRKLRTALLDIIKEQLRVLPQQPLTENAANFRSRVLELYCPKHEHPRKRAIALGFCSVFNGDWRRRGQVTHICAGCCESAEETAEKMCDVASQLMRAVRPSKLCRGNWLEWERPLEFMLLYHVHALLAAAFEKAFTNQPQEPADEET